MEIETSSDNWINNACICPIYFCQMEIESKIIFIRGREKVQEMTTSSAENDELKTRKKIHMIKLKNE